MADQGMSGLMSLPMFMDRKGNLPQSLLEESIKSKQVPDKTYTVSKGDTLYKIAKVTGTTVANLKKSNNIRDVTKLQIGQKLKLPLASSPTGLLAPTLSEGYVDTIFGEASNDDSLDEVARLISIKDNVPAAWLVKDVINPMAWHESATTMDPKTVQDNNGPGRGMLQFEGTMGVEKQAVHDKNVKNYLDVEGNNVKVGDLKFDINNKPVMGKDSFEVAVKRAKDFYKKIAEKDVPPWITNIEDNTNASDLTSNQQRALGLLNMKMQKTSSFKNLYKNFNDDTLGKFWKKHHHKGSSDETTATAEDRLEDFKGLQKSYKKSMYNSYIPTKQTNSLID
tara:strand:+ start:134 stop:1144 length:1011 start_codon:yes stop_codon:yes gene_type:complete